MYELRQHQVKKSNELLNVLKQYNIAYLAGMVRSGKTLTALKCSEMFGVNSILFVTKKKAISSIESDHKNFGFTYKLTCINYESLHKIESNNFDLVIYDEAHSLGAMPKKSKCTKLAKQKFYNIPCILMSGTPSTETYSQLYHQFYVSKYSPFKQYTTFYKWAKVFVNKKELRLPTHTVIDYSDAKVKEIDKVIKPYIVTMTQADAGFDVNITEHILKVETPKQIKSLAKRLLRIKLLKAKQVIF